MHSKYRNTRNERVIKMLKPHVAGAVLDVGCFDGAVAQVLSANVQGIDVALPPEPKVPATLFDGRHIPFSDQSFDTVLCSFVLHHSQDPTALVGEMRRVGKRLVILEDTFDHFVDRASVISSHWLAYLTVGIPFDRRAFRPSKGWQELFRAAGLNVVQVERQPSVMPGFPLLRHDLYVLEAA